MKNFVFFLTLLAVNSVSSQNRINNDHLISQIRLYNDSLNGIRFNQKIPKRITDTNIIIVTFYRLSDSVFQMGTSYIILDDELAKFDPHYYFIDKQSIYIFKFLNCNIDSVIESNCYLKPIDIGMRNRIQHRLKKSSQINICRSDFILISTYNSNLRRFVKQELFLDFENFPRDYNKLIL